MAKAKTVHDSSNKSSGSKKEIQSKLISDYQSVLNKFENGYAFQKIITDKKGNPIDFEYLEVNPAFEKLMGLKASKIIGKRVTEIFPDFSEKETDWIKFYGEVALKGKSKSIDFYSTSRKKWMHINSHSPKKNYFIVEILDITKRKEAEISMLESNRQLNNIIESISDAFVSLDKNWRYTFMNKKAGEIFGRDPKEIIGKHIWTEFPEGVGQPFHQAYEKAFKEQIFIQLEEHYTPYDKWFENRIYPTKEGLSIFFHDITDRKKAEIELKKVTRTYAVIRQINQMIVRENDINKIFKKSCNIAVKFGKFRMSWIGLVDENTQIVNPVFWDGKEDGYLSNIMKITLDNEIIGKGPTAAAINEGKHYFCNDIANDPIIAPWRDEALKRGYRSSIALPLKLHDKVIGSFNLYSEYTNFFNDTEIKLLLEIADDISYAIENIENEEIKKNTEDALKENERFLSSIIENLPNMIFIKDAKELRFIRFNKAGENLLGYKREELLGKNDYDFFPKEQADLFTNKDKEVLNRGKAINIPEEPIDTKEGRRILHTQKIPIQDKDGNPAYLLGISEDITERIQSERKIIESEQYYRTIFENTGNATVIIDEDTTYSLVNSKFEELSGYSKDEIENKMHWERFVHKDDIDKMKEKHRLRRLDPSKAERSYEFRFVDKSGIVKDLLISIDLIPGTKKSVASLLDITERKLSENKIHESEKRYKMLFNRNPVPMLIYERGTLQLLDVNEAFINHYGYSYEKVISMRLTDLYPEEQKIPITELSGKIQGHAYAGEWQHLKADGTLINILATSHDLIYEERNCRIAVMIDVTDMKNVEKEILQNRQELESIYNTVGDVIFLLKVEGENEYRFVSANKRFSELTGLDTSMVTGKFVDEVIPEPSLTLVKQNYKKAVEEKSIVRWEETTEYPTGTQTAMVSVSPVFDVMGNCTHLVGSVHDITERKMIEDKINRMNIELEERVRIRTKQLEESNKELEAFSYSVSHDLRAPLRAISGFSKLLKEEYYDKLDEEGKEYLSDITLNSVRMANLIDDLLELSRYGRKKMEKYEIQMKELFISIFEDEREHAKNPNITFNIMDIPNIKGDYALIKQVVINLISNAIKYSSKTPNPVIEIGSTVNEKENIYYIKDNGVGFDMKYAHKLFGVFQRLHNLEEYEGTGVGLAIVQRIINKHNGKVWAESEPGKGTIFYFSLPRE